ncbi:hypothetical protein EV421DRAFT_1739752 [Armillaria borealis]|uniref:Uncharacterized protein n=1 Tax=Armillaria borealis TaxID=47425 RepID=A0AA39J4N9_9AGAR|nr:hypothetical protein EV421DRAFT_1739752 [Armillaria borealis]
MNETQFSRQSDTGFTMIKPKSTSEVPGTLNGYLQLTLLPEAPSDGKTQTCRYDSSIAYFSLQGSRFHFLRRNTFDLLAGLTAIGLLGGMIFNCYIIVFWVQGRVV